jgi:hypothetical protein
MVATQKGEEKKKLGERWERFDYCNEKRGWSHPSDLNRRPTDYESVALPAELGWRFAMRLMYLA